MSLPPREFAGLVTTACVFKGTVIHFSLFIAAQPKLSDMIEDACKSIISIRVRWVMARSASTTKVPLWGLGCEAEGSRSDKTLKMFW